jgi:hypothetical protein
VAFVHSSSFCYQCIPLSTVESHHLREVVFPCSLPPPAMSVNKSTFYANLFLYGTPRNTHPSLEQDFVPWLKDALTDSKQCYTWHQRMDIYLHVARRGARAPIECREMLGDEALEDIRNGRVVTLDPPLQLHLSMETGFVLRSDPAGEKRLYPLVMPNSWYFHIVYHGRRILIFIQTMLSASVTPAESQVLCKRIPRYKVQTIRASQMNQL